MRLTPLVDPQLAVGAGWPHDDRLPTAATIARPAWAGGQEGTLGEVTPGVLGR